MYTSSNPTIGQKRSINYCQPINIILNKVRSRLPSKVPSIPQIHSVSLIGRKGVDEDEVGKITVFELGLSINIPKCLTLQMISTPTLISHGYMLANGISFVQSNTPLTVQLYKFREGPDLELPYEGIYLVPQRINSVRYNRVEISQPARVENHEFAPEFTSSSSLPKDTSQQIINTIS